MPGVAKFLFLWWVSLFHIFFPHANYAQVANCLVTWCFTLLCDVGKHVLWCLHCNNIVEYMKKTVA